MLVQKRPLGICCTIRRWNLIGRRRPLQQSRQQDQQLKDPSLIDNDPELRGEVDKLRRQGLLYQRKDEDRRWNDRRLAYYDD